MMLKTKIEIKNAILSKMKSKIFLLIQISCFFLVVCCAVRWFFFICFLANSQRFS